MLTENHLKKLASGLKQFRVLFLDNTVELAGGGTVTVPLYVTRRSASVSDLTGGIQQEATLCLILKEEWDTLSPGRPPTRNDVATYQGRRYAFGEVYQVAPGNVDMLYRCKIKG